MKKREPILLVNPLASCGKLTTHSLGLVFIMSHLLQRKFSANISDRNAFVYNQKKTIQKGDDYLIKTIKRKQPRFIGITMMTINFDDVAHTSKLIKKYFPDVKIIFGGTHPTHEPFRTLKQIREVDIVVRGPGERITEMILMGEPLGNIPNIAYRECSGIKETALKKIFRHEGT